MSEAMKILKNGAVLNDVGCGVLDAPKQAIRELSLQNVKNAIVEALP